jgi:hypothetical protein
MEAYIHIVLSVFAPLTNPGKNPVIADYPHFFHSSLRAGSMSEPVLACMPILDNIREHDQSVH